MEEKILALHPDKNKQPVRIAKAKYETIRAAIISALRAHAGMTFTELAKAVQDRLAGRFEGSIMWYVTTVKLDLEARNLIQRVPKSSPQRLRLVKS